MLETVWTWFVTTLRAHPELTVFLALAMGFLIGPRKVKGFALGSVTATLLAGILIGQLGIQVEGPIKAAFFLLFLFAVGYSVGPQFFQGISREGPKQIVFSLIVLALCLLVPVVCAWLAGLFPARAQDDVLSRLSGTDVTLVRRFESTPFLALEVGPSALGALRAMGDVVARIVPDSVLSPSGRSTSNTTSSPLGSRASITSSSSAVRNSQSRKSAISRPFTDRSSVPGSIPSSAAMLSGWTRLTRTMVSKKVRALSGREPHPT